MVLWLYGMGGNVLVIERDGSCCEREEDRNWLLMKAIYGRGRWIPVVYAAMGTLALVRSAPVCVASLIHYLVYGAIIMLSIYQ